VVALKDAAGTIYWSWHLWVTDNPTTKTWTNNGYIFMDRNLGATEAALSLAGRGLFYQWGRKDPFPGGKAGTAGYAALDKFKGMLNAGSSDVVKVTNTAMDAAGIADGILESIRKPTTFFSGVSSQHNWLPADKDDLWNVIDANVSKKTIYDPCPTGWRIPHIGIKSPWYGLTGKHYIGGDQTGRDWSTPAGSGNALYPSAGKRISINGKTEDIGRAGYYLTASVMNRWAARMSFDVDGKFLYAHEGSKSDCSSVRCVQE
jgi:hypothetical protein